MTAVSSAHAKVSHAPAPGGALIEEHLHLQEEPRADRRRLMRIGLAYAAMLGGTAVVFLLVRSYGQRLVAQGTSGFGTTAGPVESTSFAHVLLALVVILAACRGVGALFRRIHQPAVMGEIIAGVLLGPSLLGMLAPAVANFVFPSALAATQLKLLADGGVVAFMFLVGLEFNPKVAGGRSHAAIAISHAGIVVPFLLGSTVALTIYSSVATADVPFTVFAMFMGISMSVTAFPVLARILAERRMTTTPVGTLALTCAAVDDATAWCLLAAFIGIARAQGAGGLSTAYLTALYVLAMFTVVRPMLARYVYSYEDREPTPQALAVVLMAMIVSALIAEVIGIHAIFGGFLLGAIIPHDTQMARRIVANLEGVVTVVLLPIFFALTGLRTQIGLISSMSAWLLCALLILIACLGKFGGSLCAARLAGIRWRQAAILGALMNTRGLMELIVLNIGLELKIISPTLFTMLVIMAIVTTFLTTPVVDGLTLRGRRFGASII